VERVSLVIVAVLLSGWTTSNKEDHFGEGGTFSAVTLEQTGGPGLVVKCVERRLAVRLVSGGGDMFKTGTSYVVKLRADKGPITTTAGKAISERIIQLETQADMVRTIRKASETALRVESATDISSTFVYNTAGGVKAFARIAQGCNLD